MVTPHTTDAAAAAAATAAREPRPRCLRCRRPTSVCYCASIPCLPTRTRVVILQHPRERDMPIGTARMASLALPQAVLRVGRTWDHDAALAAELNDPSRPAILLYPGPGARDILRDPPTGPVTLVVVDGTWSQAKTVVRDSACLRELPRYAFAAPTPSEYRIRREPDDAFVSTIEALMHVLGALEGDAERFRALLVPFRAMVDAQLARKGDDGAPRQRRARPPVPMSARLPAAISERWDQVVAMVGEANAWPYQPAAGEPARPPRPGPPLASRRGDELVQWVAHRAGRAADDAGATFAALAAPRRPLSPSTPYHTRLLAEVITAAPPVAEVLTRWSGFGRAGDVLASWGPYPVGLWAEHGGVVDEWIDVRAAAQRLTSRKFGSLDAYAATLGPAPAPLAPGRAGHRLALLVQILTAWRAML